MLRLIGRKTVRQSTCLGVSLLAVLSVLLLGSPMALAGELTLSNPYIPRPYAVTGLSINGAGYNSISEVFGGGFRVDSLRIISNVEVGYNNARKTKDGTIDNRKGHSRSAQAQAILSPAKRVLYRLRSTVGTAVNDELFEASLASDPRSRQRLSWAVLIRSGCKQCILPKVQIKLMDRRVQRSV